MQNSIQKKNKKILFLIDIKNRDLPSSALIAYHLMKMKYKVYFQSVLNPQNNFGFHKKTFDAVIFPKFNNSGDRFIYSYLQAKKNNKLIICIENEGNQNYLNKKKFLFHPDVYFFWGNQQKKKYNFKKNIRKVLGSPKMDFFHKKFRKITSTKAIKNKLGIKNKTKIITFMTRTQEAHREINQIKAISKRRKKMYLEPPHLFLDFYKATRKILKKKYISS